MLISTPKLSTYLIHSWTVASLNHGVRPSNSAAQGVHNDVRPSSKKDNQINFGTSNITEILKDNHPKEASPVENTHILKSDDKVCEDPPHLRSTSIHKLAGLFALATLCRDGSNLLC